MKPYYQEDGITLYCGDCRALLPEIEYCDLLLTDPPYGLGKLWNGGTWGVNASSEAREWDMNPADGDLLRAALEKTKQAIIWGGELFPSSSEPLLDSLG